MDTNNNEKQLSMAECRKNGLLWVDTGENMNQQVFTRGLCQDFNQTRPTETEKKMEIWKQLFASCGENIWIEPPLTLAMGNTVTIGDNVWIGSNVVICAGVTIGMGSVIGAGSVVTRSIPPMSFAAGVPCKVIREITEDDLNEFEPIPE